MWSAKAGNKKAKPVRDGNPDTGHNLNNIFLYMYFNFLQEPKLASIASVKRSPSLELPRSAGSNAVEVTVLTSLDHPLNKRFKFDENGEVKKDNYQNAFLYDAETTTVSGIEELARVIEVCSAATNRILIRGSPAKGKHKRVQRLEHKFPEHPEGTPWVMLDFDDVALPDGFDPLSLDAIEWVITKLPPEFHEASYFYQHSASAGILQSDGTPLKSGLNVHLFFWLNRRIPGKTLSAYLTKHCFENGLYQIEKNQGGVVQPTTWVDPAPIRSSVQPHFVAAPTIDTGVQCRLVPEKRQGLVPKAQDSVCAPEIGLDFVDQARRIKTKILEDYKRRHGYQTRTVTTSVAGKIAVTHYSVPARDPSQSPRIGRTFLDGRLRDEKYLTLYFDDEGSPGSWYVCRDRPQLAYRHGDAAALPLKELSLGAHEHVRDKLRWFSEVPHRHLELVNGYLPTLSDFATAKVSLVLSPTGSGKTTATIHWIRSQIERRQLVLYAAPTIALVKQMRDELVRSELNTAYYEEIWGMNFPPSGVIVTTIDSLPRLLKEAYANNVAHSLIFDEIHQGLDRFMGRSTGLTDLESALSKSRQSLLLTGTLTDVQRHALVEVARHALGTLTENDIERLGGTAKSAKLLGAFPADVEQWIDEHHVPQPFADRIHELTGAQVSGIQEPPTVLIGEACLWPPVRSSDIQKRLRLPPLAEDGATRIDS
ncbi:hypothetical protein BZM26_12760 [Paraburkholderia strydomiana]|nr:hypothetical protein BZM26_12760 [Paraburkholderia strydomiana]